MSLHAFKPRFQAALRPSVRVLHRVGVTANQVTVAACVVSVLLGAWLAVHPEDHATFLLLPAWMLLRMAMNAIDGMLAREFGHQSLLGAYLNELADVVSDAALYLPFAFIPAAGIAPVAAVIFLSAVCELAGVLGMLGGAGRRHDGPMGKSDRALMFGALGLLLGVGVAPGAWLSWVLWIIAASTLATIVNRVRRGIAGKSDTLRE